MDAPIPPEFGGGRELIADPQNTGISTTMGDSASLSLQMMDLLRGAIPEGGLARFNNIAEGLRQVVAASNASHTREQSTRVLQPITRIPLEPYGAMANIANIRMYNVPTFTGASTDVLDVVRWMSRILILAESHLLTFPATINLMIQGSSGGAADYIEQMRGEGKTLSQVVQQLEMRYGDLCTPEEARVKCNNMIRKEREGLPEFIDRLRSMSRMACRLELNENAKRVAIDVLVEGNIRRVLPTSVRNALEERVINRSRMGLPAFSAREIEKECLDLERRREERKQGIVEQAIQKKHVRQAQLEETDSSNSDDSSSEDELENEDEGTFQLVCEIKQQERKYAARGQYVDPQKVYRKAFKNYNQKYQNRRYPNKNAYPQRKYAPKGAAQFIGSRPEMQGNVYQRQNGPPNKIDNSQRKTITELLNLANCQRGQCIQCGVDGHMMHQDVCALKDKPLVDRACAKCGKGLHAADDCVKIYQQRYVTPQQQPIEKVQQVQDEILNE